MILICLLQNISIHNSHLELNIAVFCVTYLDWQLENFLIELDHRVSGVFFPIVKSTWLEDDDACHMARSQTSPDQIKIVITMPTFLYVLKSSPFGSFWQLFLTYKHIYVSPDLPGDWGTGCG